MARDTTARERDGEASLLDRRSYLRLAGAAAVSVATFGSGDVAAQSDGVLVSEDFENGDWTDHFTWSFSMSDGDITTNRSHGGDACLRVDVPEGEHGSMLARYRPHLAGDADAPLDEMYTSTWIWFDPDFDTRPHNGKFGGGLTGVAEGGSPAAGTGAPSAENDYRWRFSPHYRASTPSDDDIEVGAYGYWFDTEGSWGDGIGGVRAPKGEWINVEMYAKLNTLDADGNPNRDGKLKLWANGEQSIDRDIRLTNHQDALDRGVNASFTHYFGGDPSPQDQVIYMDDWTLVAGTRPDGTDGSDGSSGGSGSDGSEDTTTDEPNPEVGDDVLELVAGSNTSGVSYAFTVEGSVEKRTDAGDLSAEDNDSITDNGDGTVTVEGTAGNGYGDSYVIDGIITSTSIDESVWTIRYGGQEVGAAEITFPNKLVIDGSNATRGVSNYEFTVSGAAVKSGVLGSINGYDTVENGVISGRVVAGVDGYRFSGEITGFTLDGPALVTVEDGS